MDIPVFLVTGFLESGKTSFIIETLSDDEFSTGEKTLLICCEEGIEEYDEKFLKSKNVTMVMVEEKEELTEEFLKKCNAKVKPQRVLIEYNGTWELEQLFKQRVPKGWVMAQFISTVDATTFEVYVSNMGKMMAEQVAQSDLIIFNRCNENTNRKILRRNIKLINRKAQLIYENENGEVDETNDDDLPFDLNADVIEILDDDYGLWYMDISDNPEKYIGKKVKIKGMVYKSKDFSDEIFVPGRFAMTCCADDLTFVGFVTKYDDAYLLDNKQWVMVTADIKSEYNESYKAVGPVLYATKVEKAEEPKEKVVYFS